MKWLQQAACRGMDPSAFYLERGETSYAKDTIQICRSCPVQPECLEYALDSNERFGIWGGMTVNQREQVRDLRRTEQWDALQG